MSRVEFTWRGRAAKAASSQAIRTGLYAAGEFLLAKSKPLSPFQDGDLEGSAAVTVVNDRKVAVHYNTPYAVKQHESLHFRHPRRGQAKYLEDPFNAHRETMKKIIARAVERQLGGGK